MQTDIRSASDPCSAWVVSNDRAQRTNHAKHTGMVCHAFGNGIVAVSHGDKSCWFLPLSKFLYSGVRFASMILFSTIQSYFYVDGAGGVWLVSVHYGKAICHVYCSSFGTGVISPSSVVQPQKKTHNKHPFLVDL